jgi:two-component system chemotaxis response regulator CheB
VPLAQGLIDPTSGTVIAGRVLIVDDSVVARAALARIVDATGHFSVSSAVASVPEALSFLALHRVDFILLDLELPGVSGLTGLPELLRAGRGARILVVSSSTGEGAAATVQALALGAADTLEKPGIGAFSSRFGAALIQRLERLADGGTEPIAAAPVAIRPTLPRVAEAQIIAVGASTGGIHALSRMLRTISTDVTVPMLITQHLPASFMPYFAAQLSLLAGRPCEVAHDHMRIRPGRIIVAPGDAHLCCAKAGGSDYSVRLTHEASASGCMPSVDPMLTSVAQVFGSRGMGVVLSGMGRDGAIGAARLLEAGGSVIVQDRASSVVWGMPGAIAERGAATAILPPEEIGHAITRAGRA